MDPLGQDIISLLIQLLKDLHVITLLMVAHQIMQVRSIQSIAEECPHEPITGHPYRPNGEVPSVD